MSDSELSDAPTRDVPSDRVLERALRKETDRQFGEEEFTVNTIRKGAEETLALDVGFFLNDKAWKARSKTIIKDEMDILNDAPQSNPRTGAVSRSPAKPKAGKATSTAAPKKRPSPGSEKPPKKRQKKLPKGKDDDELSSLPAEEGEDKPRAKKNRPKPKVQKESEKESSTTALPKKPRSSGKPKAKTPESESELSDAPAEDFQRADSLLKMKEDSGSEMSVLLDEDPAPKKKRRSKDPSDKPKKSAKAKPTADDDPDQEEIKRLQGWLVKCGVRKIWSFELKPYETSKAKIKHLKEMLSDVGMTGRYSLEKASQIKESRELAADIEAVQEGNEIWGKDVEEKSRRPKRSDPAEDDDEEGDRAPKGKLVRGPKRYEFLSSDGDESD